MVLTCEYCKVSMHWKYLRTIGESQKFEVETCTCREEALKKKQEEESMAVGVAMEGWRQRLSKTEMEQAQRESKWETKRETERESQQKQKEDLEVLWSQIRDHSKTLDGWRKRLVEIEFEQAQAVEADLLSQTPRRSAEVRYREVQGGDLEYTPCCPSDCVTEAPQGCWYEEEDVWKTGTLLFWSNDYEENDGVANRSYPVAVIKPSDGSSLTSVYIEQVNLNTAHPDGKDKVEAEVEAEVAGEVAGETLAEDSDDPQRCWYLDENVWEAGILQYWGTDYDENGQYPVGMVEPIKSGPMLCVYAGDISLGPNEPEPVGTEETIAEIVTKGSGHMRAYRLPNERGKLEKIAVQMEPNALIIMSIGGLEAEQGRLTRAQVQGIAILHDGEIECDAPDIDMHTLETIFNVAECETGRTSTDKCNFETP